LKFFFKSFKRDTWRYGNGFENTLKDICLNQAALIVAIQPEIFDILNKLNPEGIKDDIGNSTLSISHQRCCDGYIKCWRLSEPPHQIDISRHIFERLGKSL